MTSSSSPPNLDTVKIELDNGVALLKFNRPKAGNALNRKAFKVSNNQMSTVLLPQS